MVVKNMTEFRKSMKETMDVITDNDETVIISRSDDRDVVLLSIKSFNSIQETLHLMSSPKNAERLRKSIKNIEAGQNLVTKDILA